MFTCKYCKKPTGFFRFFHTECKMAFDEQQLSKKQRRILLIECEKRTLTTLTPLVKNQSDLEMVFTYLTEMSRQYELNDEELRKVTLKLWDQLADNFIKNGIISKNHELILLELKEKFSFSQDELDNNGKMTKLAKSLILREIKNGKIPNNFLKLEGNPINFQKGETPIWGFNNTDLIEDKTFHEYVSGSQGVSVRIMKGLYYRVGASRGQRIEYTNSVIIDSGIFLITDKNVYFSGQKKAIRIPFTKIVSFLPYSDAVGIMKDGTNSKVQIFATGDGEFTYNLLKILATGFNNDSNRDQPIYLDEIAEETTNNNRPEIKPKQITTTQTYTKRNTKMAIYDEVPNSSIQKCVESIPTKHFTTLRVITELERQFPDQVSVVQSYSTRNWRALIGKALKRFAVETNKVKQVSPPDESPARWEKQL